MRHDNPIELMTTHLNDRKKALAKRLQAKGSRDRFVESQIRNCIAHQLRTMRLERDLTQKELADLAGKQQEAISRAENPNYGKFTLETLRQLAAALDVALLVRFVPFSELLNRTVNMSPQDLAVPSFVDDQKMHEREKSVNNFSFVVYGGAENTELPFSLESASRSHKSFSEVTPLLTNYG